MDTDKCRAPARMRRSAGFILQNVRGGGIKDQALDPLRSGALQHKCRAPARMRGTALDQLINPNAINPKPIRAANERKMVRAAGFEPATPSV